jgi:hypothetical protein
VHGIIETPTYLADAKAAGVLDDELEAIATKIALAPVVGDLMPARVALVNFAWRSLAKAKALGIA